jgi:integrase
MRGSIYTRQKCRICGGPLVYHERLRALVCYDHQGERATGEYYVKFGRQARRTFTDLAAAERFLTGLRFKSDEGTFDARDYKADRPLSFINLSEKWLTIKEKEVKPSSFDNLRRYIRLAQKAWGHANVKALDYASLEDFLSSLPLSDKTCHNVRSCLHAFWSWLCHRKVITLAQFPEFPEVKFNLGYRKIIDKATQQAIIEEVRRISYTVNPKIWLGIKWLSTYIAIRPGELVQIQEGDIDVKMGIFTVRHTKEGRHKFVPMLEEDKAFVASLPQGLPHLPFFRHGGGVSGCTSGQPFGHKYFYKWWLRACENLGVAGVDLYGGTRHSSATALKQYLTPEQIKAGTMHSTNKAFERYFQTNSADALEVFRLASDAPPLHHGSDKAKNNKVLKLKVKNGGGAGS